MCHSQSPTDRQFIDLLNSPEVVCQMRASVHVVYRNTENITVSLISLEPYKDRNLSHYLTRTKKALLTMNAAGLFLLELVRGFELLTG